MQEQEAVQIIQSLFERYNFTVEYEADYDDLGGKWTILFGPRDKDLVMVAECIEADEKVLLSKVS